MAALHAGVQAEEECQDLDGPDSHHNNSSSQDCSVVCSRVCRLSLSRMPQATRDADGQ